MENKKQVGANGGLDGFVPRIREIPRCPKCKATDTIPILYGLPSPGWEQRVEKGRAVIGGCVVDGDEPDRECSSCHTQFVWPLKGKRVAIPC